MVVVVVRPRVLERRLQLVLTLPFIQLLDPAHVVEVYHHVSQSVATPLLPFFIQHRELVQRTTREEVGDARAGDEKGFRTSGTDYCLLHNPRRDSNAREKHEVNLGTSRIQVGNFAVPVELLLRPTDEQTRLAEILPGGQRSHV
jgi:hypothetical protein